MEHLSSALPINQVPRYDRYAEKTHFVNHTITKSKYAILNNISTLCLDIEILKYCPSIWQHSVDALLSQIFNFVERPKKNFISSSNH